MMNRIGKTIISLLLAFVMLAGLVPMVGPSAGAAEVLDLSSLTCKNESGVRSDAVSFMDTMMKYYINHDSNLRSTLLDGKSVIFMFEGGSSNFTSSDNYKLGFDGKKYYGIGTRNQAITFVVQAKNNKPQIVWSCNDCSSIPDVPHQSGEYNRNHEDTNTSKTLADGTYNVKLYNHCPDKTDLYMILHVESQKHSGINIHTRISNSAEKNWSWGCLLVGEGNSYLNPFNTFMRKVTEPLFNLVGNVWEYYTNHGLGESKLYTMEELGVANYRGYSAGYVVVNRYLAKDALLNIYPSENLNIIISDSVTKWDDAKCDHTPGVKLTDGSWKFETRKKEDGTYAAFCKECGQEYIIPKIDTSTAGVYTCLVTATKCSQPFQETKMLLESLTIGRTYIIEGSIINAYGDTWYKVLNEDRWIYERYFKYKEALPKPSTPTNITGYFSDNTVVQLNWDSVSGATSYEVEYYSESKKAWSALKKSPTTTNSISGDFSGVSYLDFRIRAINANGQSDWSATTRITKNNSIAVTSVSLNKTTTSLKVGSTETLTATVSPSNATNKSVTWTSSNTSVATVDTSGKVTAKAAGTATITATAGGKPASCTVTVNSATSTLAAPKNLTGKMYKDSSSGDYIVTLKWEAVSGAASYTVMYYSEYKSKWIELKESENHGITTNSVEKAFTLTDSYTHLDFKVTAVNPAGLESTAVTVSVPKTDSLTYTVTYDANNGTGAPTAQTKAQGAALTLSSTKPTRNSSSTGSYTVTLNANGGSVSSTSLSANRTTSYTFKNWNTAANGSGTAYNSGASYTADASVTLYAQWNSETATSAVTLPTPTRTGYTFKGWATSATATSGTTGSYKPNGDITLYAIWKANIPNKPVVRLAKNELTEDEVLNASWDATSYTTYYNVRVNNIDTQQKDVFTNWSYDLTSINTTKLPAGNYELYVTAVNEDLRGIDTFEASSDPIRFTVIANKTYSISFNANGGIGAPTAQTKTQGTALTLSQTIPTREEYIFLGWAESFEATEAVYQPGDVLTKDENIKLYAVWKVDESRGIEYKINSIKLRNAKYDEITAIPKGKFYAEVNVTNLSSKKIDTLLLATYNMNGKMIGLYFMYSNPQINQEFILGALVDNTNGDIAKLKAFMLPVLGSVEPLAEAVELT